MRYVMERTVVGADSSLQPNEAEEKRERDQKEAIMTMLTFIGFGMSLIGFLDSQRHKK
jgi:hypothetical protein